MTNEKQNAIIEATHLGVQHTDHGILSFSIVLAFEGAGQSYGQYVLDAYDKNLDSRVPTPLAASLLLAIDKVFSVDWEDLRGISCRVFGSRTKIHGIGHFLKDKWLWLDIEKMQFVVTPFYDIVVPD